MRPLQAGTRRASSGRHGPQRLTIVRERRRARPAAARRALHQVVLDELRAQQQRARVAQVVLGCAHITGCHAPQPKAQRTSKSHRMMREVRARHRHSHQTHSQAAHVQRSHVLVRTDAQRVGEGGGARVGQARVEHLGVAVDARLHLPRRHQLRQLAFKRTAVRPCPSVHAAHAQPMRQTKLLPAPPARLQRAS